MYCSFINNQELLNKLDILIAQNSKTFSNDALIVFLGGFSGAFFAFFFDRFAEFINKRRERYIRHKNAMVRMEYALVKHQDRVNRLCFLLEKTVEILRKPAFTYNRFDLLGILEDIEIDLADINTINLVANYWMSVERVNGDCLSINRVLEILQQIALSGIPPHQDNFRHLIEQMEYLKKYLESKFINENIELNAILRIVLKRDKEISGLNRFFSFYKVVEEKISKREINIVKKQILKEMKQREKTDLAELTKMS